jgi:hypothetical protein
MENQYSYFLIKRPKRSIKRGDDAFLYRIEFLKLVADGDDRDGLLRDSVSTSLPTVMPRTKMMTKPALFRTFRTAHAASAAHPAVSLECKSTLIPLVISA